MGRQIVSIGLVGAALALALAPAAAAWADVQDPGNLSPPDLETISTGLAGLNAEDDFDIVIIGATPSDGLDAEAARQFAANDLDPRQGCIVLDLPGKAVGVALGQTFLDAGIAGEPLRNRIDVAFSRAPSPAEGVVELARQLKVMRATGAAAPLQFPWALLVAGLAGLAGFVGLGRWRAARDRRDALRAHLAGARQAAGRAAQSRVQLVQAVGHRGRSGASAGLAARLLRLGEAAATAASEIAVLIAQAETAHAAGRPDEASRLARAAEARGFQAEAALAAARTAAAELDVGVEALRAKVAAAAAPSGLHTEARALSSGLHTEARAAAEADDAAACLAALARAGAIPRSPADLVADAEAAARDWLAIRAIQDHQAGLPGASAVGSQVLLRRLHELRIPLTSVPLGLDEAEVGLAQLLGGLASARPPVRVQRVGSGDAAPDPEALWDLSAARHVVSSGAAGEPPTPAPRGPRGRAM